MRTLVDIPDKDLKTLTHLSKVRRVSRSELVRTAVSRYLAAQGPDVLTDAFGLWAKHAEDGLAYQQRMRDEW